MAFPPVPGYWVHDLDPFLIQFWGSVGIRWYGLAYIAGIVGGALLVLRWARQGRTPLRPHEVQDFAFAGGLGMILGGRLGYVLFYAWDTFLSDPLYLFRVWEGGMASHGGIAGLFAGAWWFSRRHRRDLLVLCDTICAVAPIGVICGRLANFINGELWGRPMVPPRAWGVIFPEAPPVDGWLVPRHPSQLYAVALEGAIPLLIVLWLHARHRRPGLTMGALLVLYGIGRFIGEFFREPDFGQPGSPGHDFILGFMTKGQALTLPLIAIGVVIAAWSLSRPPRPTAYAAPGDVATR